MDRRHDTERAVTVPTGDALDAGRRAFLRASGLAAASSAAMGLSLGSAGAADEAASTVTDVDVLNFALNLEYLEAEFYFRAVFGRGLDSSDVQGKGKLGGVRGGHKVHFDDPFVNAFAGEIARDERAHVMFLRKALGSEAVARPALDFVGGFNAAAVAAGLVKPGENFDVFGSTDNFLLGAFLFEDVGVTAYKGAATLIANKGYLTAAAGILAVEAYHAGEIRTLLSLRRLDREARAISNARDSLDGPKDMDQPIRSSDGFVNVVPTNGNGIAYGRTPEQVLNVVYLGGEANHYGFYPHRFNGAVR